MNRILIAGALAAAALAPAAASAEGFQGPYIGAQAGWNHDTAIAGDKDSFVGGAFAGYDHQVTPNIVLGAEAGFQLGASDRITSGNARLDPLHSFDLSARAGYVVGGNTLLYARGGYENTRARLTAPGVSNLRTYDGWFVGGGAERKLLDNVSARLEYRYADLGSNGRGFDRHQVLAGVAYRF